MLPKHIKARTLILMLTNFLIKRLIPMVQKKLKRLIFPLILLNLVIFSTFPSGIAVSLNEVPKISNAPMSNVVIDGVINASEWADADWE
ncbi:hypothetical protein LCGC14_1266620, partial [marine sediment metagenome]